MRLMNIPLLILISSLFVGCARDSKDHLLPQNGPTMKEVYDNHFSGGDSLYVDDPLNEEHKEKTHGDEVDDDSENCVSPPPVIVFGKRPIHAGDVDLDGYTRSAHTEIQSIFTRLPNPTLVMYIYPHLAGSDRHPVPGYSTVFPLYKTVQYALPGENEQDENEWDETTR